MKTTSRTFWSITFAVMLTLTAIHYAPMFGGKVPFPSTLVFTYPPFAAAAPSGAQPPQPDIGDLVTSFYPFRTLAARAVREGSVPLWNPHILSGTPFLANAQSAIFYPPNFLYYILPIPVAWAIGFPLRILLAAVFTALFVKRIGGSMTGSTVSGVIFAFCGFLTAWQGQPMSDAAVWLPLICYSVVHLQSSPSLARSALAAFSFAMPVLAGHPETAIHVAIMGILLAAYVALIGESTPVRLHLDLPFIGYFILAGTLALGLAAVQFLPTVEWLRYTHRSFVDTWPALPLWSVLAFASRDVVRATNSIGLHIPEHAAYLGMLTFVGVPLALLYPPKRFVVFFAVFAAAAISVIYGIGPVFWLTQHAPIIKIVKNHRMLLLCSFSLAVLAGLGISALERLKPSDSVQRQRAVMLVALGGSVAVMMVYAVRILTDQVTEFVRFPRFSFYILLGILVPIGWKLIGGLKGWRFGVLIVAIQAVDVLTFASGSIQFTAPRDIFPSIELFDRIKQPQQPPFRMVGAGYAYGANFELMYGLSAAGGYDVCLERIKQFTSDIAMQDMSAVNFTTKAILESKDRRLDMLNAKYYVVSQRDPLHLEFRKHPGRFRFLFATGNTDVYENLNVLPAAFIVPAKGIEIIQDETRQLERVKDPAFDPERSVVLAEATANMTSTAASPPASLPTRVEWVAKRTNDFELNVDNAEPSVLVISQVYYPGWKGFVDGRQVPITRANYALSAISLPPGQHQVRFSFDPLSFKIGLLLTVAATFIALTFGLRPRLR